MTKPSQRSPADDGVKPEVAPPSPRQPRSRSPNPTIDEVIHTGEIKQAGKAKEPRSRVVRAGTEPKIAIDDPRLAPSVSRRRQTWPWLVAALVSASAAGVLWWIGRPAKPPAPMTAEQHVALLQPIAAMIGGVLEGDAHAVRVRAEAIASSSMLRAGIATNPETLADMARDNDLAFPVDRGQVLEVYQLRDAVRTLMLRIPTNAPEIRSPGPGHTSIEARPRKAGERDLDVTVVAAAEVASQRSGIAGEVVISAPVELGSIESRLSEIVAEASLEGAGAPIMLVPATGASGTSVSVPIATSATTASLSLFATVTPRAIVVESHRRVRIARDVCLAAAGLLMLGYLATLIRRRLRGAA